MFTAWKSLLIELGFAEVKTNENCAGAVELSADNILRGCTKFCTGELVFSIDQLRRIVNVDETGLSLDGLSGNRGGRPSLVFFDPALPTPGNSASKCGYSATLVCGGNSAGEATPPHIQLPSSAQDQNKRIYFTTIEDARTVAGRFGHSKTIVFAPSVGMNEKGGMDEEHFEKYLTDLVYRLYPDSMDIPGKRVLFKVDQGPGRSNIALLARLRAMGVYLFPSVPNSSSVTQEMDQIFDLFKSLTRGNVEALHDALLQVGGSVSLGRNDICRIVFGGSYDLGGGVSVQLEEAFERAFGMDRMLHGFAKVGCVPLTRNCLSNPKVRVELLASDDVENETEQEMRLRLLEEQLEACISYLQVNNYTKAELFSVKVARKKARPKLTQPLSEERQLAILAAKTTGAKYVATGGDHLTCDDVFNAEALRLRKKELVELQKEKETRLEASTREQLAFDLIARKEAEENCMLANLAGESKKWKNTEIDLLIKWKKGSVTATTKPNKVQEWLEVKDKAPVNLPWMEEDEQRLKDMETIKPEDTALGQERRRLKAEATAALAQMTPVELDQLKSQIAQLEASAVACLNEVISIESSDDEGTASDDNEDEEQSTGNRSSSSSSSKSSIESQNNESDSEDNDTSLDPPTPPTMKTRHGRIIRKPPK